LDVISDCPKRGSIPIIPARFTERGRLLLTACKLITAVALLIHSVFGCGLHHASACGMHEHESHEVCSSEHESHEHGLHEHESHEHGLHEHESLEHACHVSHEACCTHEDRGRHHDHGADDKCGHEEAPELVASYANSLAPACCCQHGPCEDNRGGCHSEVGCSFVPPSGPEFSPDAGLVTFVVFRDVHAQALHSSVLSGVGMTSDAHHAHSLCALLCSWQI
jgi:hypothetical protein